MTPDTREPVPARTGSAETSPHQEAAQDQRSAADRHSVYGTSTVKRKRSTQAELADLRAELVELIRPEQPVTVRRVFYLAVSAGLVEKSETTGYRLVQRELLKARRSGLVPYGWITDGTRWMSRPTTFGGLDTMLEDAAASYRRALWDNQPAEVMVFAEKEAILGVVHRVTHRWDVPIGIARGFVSETFPYEVADDVAWNARNGKRTFIYQLGDHDPSGVDAWRDLQAKVRGFLPEMDTGADAAAFERLAVTPEQIEAYSLPTRPTKITDSRSRKWTGGESVEVDAVSSPVLRELVEDAITRHLDLRTLDLTQMAERNEADLMHRIATGYRDGTLSLEAGR